MDTFLQILNSSFFPTVVVTLILGFLNYRNIEAGRKDTRRMQEKANAISETQTALNAYKDLLETEHKRRVEAEAEAQTCRKLKRDEFEAAIRSMTEFKLPPSEGETS